jgi:drug/metabolite transporter (DMT)-like permease
MRKNFRNSFTSLKVPEQEDEKAMGTMVMLDGLRKRQRAQLVLALFLGSDCSNRGVDSFILQQQTHRGVAFHHSRQSPFLVESNVLYSVREYQEVASGSSLDSTEAVIDKSVAESSYVHQELYNDMTTENDTMDYQKGLLTIGFCTLVFASLSPVMHAALTMPGDSATGPPPVLLLNAIVSVVAFGALVTGSPFLEKILPPTPASAAEEAKSTSQASSWLYNPWIGGMELGIWKALGTTANLYGLSLTTAGHGAFLIQLTTLIVPTVQGLLGVPIPRRIQASIVLALLGVVLFTQDTAALGEQASNAEVTMNAQVRLGDLLCVVAAGFYATYDLRLFQWGKRIGPRPLMTGKILVQAILSTALLVGVSGWSESWALVTTDLDTWCTPTTLLLIAWSGIMVGALVPFLQVGGQQAIGPSRAQTIYASQPLWAAVMSYFWLGETVGVQGLVGGGAFLVALFLAATAAPPEPERDSPTLSSTSTSIVS